jgi:hypothetical protein
MTRRQRPALLYITSTGTTVEVATDAVADPRERAIYRALATRAGQLADQADAGESPPPPGTGLYA